MQQTQQTEYEQLGGGAAYAAHADDGTGTTVRIVPISEGERTVGHRKTDDDSPAIWDSDVLREAVEQNKLVDPTRDDKPMPLIVKGRGGVNPHHSFEEQVEPDNILGRIDRWEYEEGTGPVGYARLADEETANRVELGLLEVSGDWLRRLGEYDEDQQGKPVTEIVGLPRIHVLERGAAAGASIDIAPEMAEALGYNPDADVDAGDPLKAQHASEGDAVRWQSDAGGSREPADERYGVVVNPAPDDSDRDWMVAVYQPTENYDGWEPRDETQPMSDGTLERVGPDGVGSLPTVSSVVEQDASLLNRLAQKIGDMIRSGDVELAAETPDDESDDGGATDSDDDDDSDGEVSDGGGEDEGEHDEERPSPSHESGANAQHSDEPAEPGTDFDTIDTMPDDNQNELREQLASVKSEKEQLADEKDDLEEQLAEREDDLEEKEEQLSEKEEQIDSLKEEVAPLKELLAEIAADGSMLNPEKIAETHSTAELVDMLADDGEDEKSYSDKVREQLSATVNPRGDASNNGDVDELTEEQLSQANDLAYEVMGGKDVQKASEEQLSAREYVKRYKGVDPATTSSADELRAQLAANGGGD